MLVAFRLTSQPQKYHLKLLPKCRCSLLFVVEDTYWTKSTETQKQPRNNTQNNMHHIINYEEASTDRNTTLPNIEGMHVLLVPILKGWQGDRRGASQE